MFVKSTKSFLSAIAVAAIIAFSNAAHATLIEQDLNALRFSASGSRVSAT